jgi:hypothetical protein
MKQIETDKKETNEEQKIDDKNQLKKKLDKNL